MARSPTATGLTYRERAWHALELALSELDVEREALVLAMAALRRTVTAAPVPAAPKPKRTYHRKPKAAAQGPEVPAAPPVRLPDEATVKQILGLLMNKHRTADVAALLKTDIDGARVVLRALVAQGRVTRGPGGHWHRAEGEQYEQG